MLWRNVENGFFFLWWKRLERFCLRLSWLFNYISNKFSFDSTLHYFKAIFDLHTIVSQSLLIWVTNHKAGNSKSAVFLSFILNDKCIFDKVKNKLKNLKIKKDLTYQSVSTFTKYEYQCLQKWFCLKPITYGRIMTFLKAQPSQKVGICTKNHWGPERRCRRRLTQICLVV